VTVPYERWSQPWSHELIGEILAACRESRGRGMVGVLHEPGCRRGQRCRCRPSIVHYDPRVNA
jgi:hypothetical protein